MRRLVILFGLILSSVFSAQAQYPHRWDIGGTLGLGPMFVSGDPDFTMSATIGFEKVIRDTRWRWCIEGGIMNQGMTDYSFEGDEPERFIRPNFEYVGALANYSLFSRRIMNEGFNIFLRAGLAPAHQRDRYIYHSEDKFTMLGIVGSGSDYGFGKFMISGYVNPQGIFILNFAFGFWFGKK